MFDARFVDDLTAGEGPVPEIIPDLPSEVRDRAARLRTEWKAREAREVRPQSSLRLFRPALRRDDVAMASAVVLRAVAILAVFAPVLAPCSPDAAPPVAAPPAPGDRGPSPLPRRQPLVADWGIMTADGRTMLSDAPHVGAIPGVMLLPVALAFSLVGDGLRDALDPRLRQ